MSIALSLVYFYLSTGVVLAVFVGSISLRDCGLAAARLAFARTSLVQKVAAVALLLVGASLWLPVAIGLTVFNLWMALRDWAAGSLGEKAETADDLVQGRERAAQEVTTVMRSPQCASETIDGEERLFHFIAGSGWQDASD